MEISFEKFAQRPSYLNISRSQLRGLQLQHTLVLDYSFLRKVFRWLKKHFA